MQKQDPKTGYDQSVSKHSDVCFILSHTHVPQPHKNYSDIKASKSAVHTNKLYTFRSELINSHNEGKL